ncbi:MAG: hypothetical protein AAF720_00895 [Pseudomonadota bacterium]
MDFAALGLSAPQDISARMELINSVGEFVYDKDGEVGWIEFWGPDAEPSRQYKRQVEREIYIKTQKEKRNGVKVPTAIEADREIDETYSYLVEAVANRVKNWRIVNDKGEVVDLPCTIENIRAFFSHPGHEYLRKAALDFCADPENFFKRKQSA